MVNDKAEWVKFSAKNLYEWHKKGKNYAQKKVLEYRWK